MDVPTITSNMGVYDILKYLDTKLTINTDILWGFTGKRFLFNNYMNRHKYDAIFYLGHGEKNKLMGSNIFGSIINERNIGKAKGTIIATMACFSSLELGRVAIKEGVRAYIGTKKEFYAFFPEKERNYLDDWRDVVTTYFKDIIDGRTVGEAFGHFQNKCKYYLSIYKKNLHYRNYDWYYKAMYHNLINTELLGDKNARLFKKTY